jgi:hypothetical protein
MNLLSLLIAPLQVVVLFFAPHAVTAKSAGVRLPSRWLAAAPSSACPESAPGRTAQRTSHSASAASAQRVSGGSTQGLRTARITYPQAVAQVTAKPIHRVRVVRNVDAALPADRAGRMAISGRFADVCAELDRLAAMDMRAAA